MLKPSSYPEHPTQVELIETHISWVFLTDRRVYKLKKPVRFDFLDFSRVELRREACRQELVLNRRLAPSTYLDVVPITIDHRDQFSFGGAGAVVDWVVKMRRLPAERAFHRLQASGVVTEKDVESLAQCLASFYQRLPPVSIGVDDYRRTLNGHLRANWQAFESRTHGSLQELVRRVHERQFRWLVLHSDLFDHRVLDGRIVEGHGDLRPEHIYLARHPAVIDCIEFNAEYRQIDVLDELGFLAMECDLLGAAWAGQRILNCYFRTSGDHPNPALLAVYQSYRACVRAKVMLLRAEQLPETRRGPPLESADAYLRLADIYVSSLGTAALIVVRGLPGSGKSTLAGQLADVLQVPRLQTDAIRRERFGAAPAATEYGQGVYRPENRSAIYEEMLRQAGELVRTGRSVILDGTFLAAAQRTAAAETASRFGAVCLEIHCRCPDELARQRIAGRVPDGEQLSETRVEFFEQQKRAEEPNLANSDPIEIDTSRSPPETLSAALTGLRARWTEPIYVRHAPLGTIEVSRGETARGVSLPGGPASRNSELNRQLPDPGTSGPR